jgi:hypothetical protein
MPNPVFISEGANMPLTGIMSPSIYKIIIITTTIIISSQQSHHYCHYSRRHDNE